jgi:hypothetical protein
MSKQAERRILQKELNKPIETKFERRRVEQSGLDHIWSLDLAGTFFGDNRSKNITKTRKMEDDIATKTLTMFVELTGSRFQDGLARDADYNSTYQNFKPQLMYLLEDRNALFPTFEDVINRMTEDEKTYIQQNMAKIRSGTQQDKLFDVLSRVVAKHLKPSKDQEQRILKRNNLDRNDGKNYILVVIDIFSRFLWTEPLEKNDKTSTNAGFQRILERALPRKPKAYLWADDGGEFETIKSNNQDLPQDMHNTSAIESTEEQQEDFVYNVRTKDDLQQQKYETEHYPPLMGNNHLNKLNPKQLKTQMYHTHSKNKAVFAERVIGTLKDFLLGRPVRNNRKNGVPYLLNAFYPECFNMKLNTNGVVFDEVIEYEEEQVRMKKSSKLMTQELWDSHAKEWTMLEYATWRYNHTFHRGLPSKTTPFDASLRQNEDALMKFFYTYEHRVLPDNKFKVGDRVRIATETGWSQIIFVIAQIKLTEPYTYKVRNAETREIHKKSFYSEELQKTQA